MNTRDRINKFILFILLFILILDLNQFVSDKLNIYASISPFILVCSVILILMILPTSSNQIMKLKKTKSFFAFFFIYFTIATINSYTIEGSTKSIFWGFRYYLPTLMIFTAVLLSSYHFISVFGILRMLKTIRALLFINIFIILFSFFTGNQYFVQFLGRYSGILSNANDAGCSGVILLVIELYLFRRGYSKYSWLSLPIIIIAIMLTLSKSAFIMTLFIGIYYLISNRRISIKRRWSFLMLVIPVSLTMITYDKYLQYMLDPYGFDRFRQTELFLKGQINDQTTTNRYSLFIKGWEDIQKNLFWGSGFYTFHRLDKGTTIGIHNEYLLLLGEGGIFSLLAYCIMLFIFWNVPYHKYGDISYLIKAFTLIIVLFSLTSHNILNNKSIIVILSIMCCMIQKNRDIPFQNSLSRNI